jgi:hypothetical protein
MPRAKKRYTLPLEFERDNFRQMLVILYHLQKKGYGYSIYPDRGPYVTLGDPDEFRLPMVKRNPVVNFAEFLAEIGLEEADLLNPNVDPIGATLDEYKEWYELYEQAHPQGVKKL